MSFATQALRYGWVALASLGALTGTTIYVLNNQRHQVKPEDVIEIALGVTERCLATQTSTNPVTYDVDPPSYTNVVTNTIGWHTDREMLISLDATVKALVPFYVNTNTIVLTTTNFVFDMLTVTGLWAELQIGDGTNRFTREPAWTNTFTNWIVCYTSYWPNEVARTNCYTSDYRQVVNYAASWTATGGYVWVTSSNWASAVVTVTNAATYGDYPRQIYAEDLEERYKVLNALKKTAALVAWEAGKSIVGFVPYGHTYEEAESVAWNSRTTNSATSTPQEIFSIHPYGFYSFSAYYDRFEARGKVQAYTSLTHEVFFYAYATTNMDTFGNTVNVFNDFGAGYTNGQINRIVDPFIVPPTEEAAAWPPTGPQSWGYFMPEHEKQRAPRYMVDWQFLYCTNKYW